MKRGSLGLFCGFLGIFAMGVAIPPQVSGQTDIPKEKLVAVLRILNTAEYSYRHENGRFASREELLTFLRTKGLLNQSPTDLAKPTPRFASQEETKVPVTESTIDLENPKPYELTITTSPNGMHYQITLQRPSDMNDKTTWCKTAAFSDDRGVIFLGSAIGCEASTQ
jgi:hypothetical protein